ncbi:MAG: C25 family cysteine peptidase [Candidatus Cloacimonetes bacterium]|nr:C25 family cysteine peptidase [Candidatus Cloacimonadota bacterium]
MKSYIAIIMLFLPLLVMGSAITIVSESSDNLTLSFKLPDYSVEEISVSGKKYHRIVCDEGLTHAEEGRPQLRVFSSAVGLPLDGSAAVNVLSRKSITIPDVDVVPAATMVLDEGEVNYKYEADFQSYNSNQLYPLNIVQLGEAAFIGDRRFIALEIYPFQYDAQNHSLLVHTEMQIAVNLSGTKVASRNWQLSENPIDKAADSFFINNASSRMWRLPKNQAQNYQAPKGSLSEISEIQFVIDSEGIYKVGYSELKQFIAEMADSLGMDMAWTVDNVDPRYLELSDENGQVPIHFSGEEDGEFNSGDYFEFFGDRHYGDISYSDDFTAENVYTLKLRDAFGARMVVENGGLINNNPLEYMLADHYEETVHLEEQLVSDKLGRGWTTSSPTFYREDVWFWKKISAPNLEIVPIELEYPFDSTIRTASAKIALHGLTYKENLLSGQYDHEATIRLNSAMINTQNWIGQTEKIFYNQAPISNSFLRHGTNNVYISLSGNTEMGDREQILLDYIELKYWREYKTSRDYIKFEKPSYRPNGLFQFDLQGFSTPNVSVYKIGSSIFSNMQIEPFNIDGAAPWTVSIQDSVSSQSIRYYAVEENSKKRPKSMRLNIPSDLKNPMNSANVIVISPYEFIGSEGTLQLKSLWESEGNIVSLVDLQDIYDEFNWGIVSAEAIKAFLDYAYQNWRSPQLSHVMLLGEGVDDTRDNSPSRKYNLVPVKKTWTYKHGATASDTWYGCLVGNDVVPDITISRLNIWTHQQILDYASKALQYRNDPQTNRLWNSHITLTAGGKISDTEDTFSQQSERIRRRVIPKDYRVSRVYTSTQSVSTEYFGGTFNLKDAINSGTQFVQFMGHGGGRVWADYNLFNFNDVATLNNQTYPVFLSLACYASAFDTNGASSISEALVLQAGKGAIAALGFSGLGYLDHDEGWGLAYNEAAFTHDFDTLGEAYIFALARFFTTTASPAARYALTNASAYLGDPLIKLNKPIANVSVTPLNPNPNAGEQVTIQAEFPSSVNSARLYVMNNNETVINVPYDLPVLEGVFNASYTIPASDDNSTRMIYVAGYSSDKEYVGHSGIGIGRPMVMHHALTPAQPTYADSVDFSARLFSPVEIVQMECSVRVDSVYVNNQWVGVWENLPMQPSNEDNTIWQTTQRLRKFNTGKDIFFKYKYTDVDNVSYESVPSSYQVAGPDLFLRDLIFDASDGVPKLKVKSTNVGNCASVNTDLRLYYTPEGGDLTLATTQDFAPLEVDAERWDTILLEAIPNGNVRFDVRVNSSNAFSEWHLFVNTNNYITLDIPFNYFTVGNSGGEYHSVDNNLSCVVPPAFVSAGNVTMAINSLQALAPLNQPDVSSIMMQYVSGIPGIQMSIPYEIRIFDPTMVDSLGIFTNGKRLDLTFKYNDSDPDTQNYEGENSYKIYRYNPEFEKWILIGGHVSVNTNTVNFEVNREGIYSIFRNQDHQVPAVDVNVQDQEFTVGGYVAGDGVISLLLSDANGIDVIDDSIRLFMNGEEVPSSDYVISINKENINRVPIKYQLALSRGNHELKADCRDLNGNFSSREVQFVVNDKFSITNIANYPNPILGQAQDPKNDGRTRFTYVLTDTADEVYIKVYTISGRLVKTFRNLPVGVGYHEYPRTVYAWDCKDEQGFPLANGTYFYRVVARKGSKKIEKTMKMAILK